MACAGLGEGDEYGYGIGPGDSMGKYDPNAPGAGLFDPRKTDTQSKLTRLPGQINPTGKMLTIPTTEPGRAGEGDGVARSLLRSHQQLLQVRRRGVVERGSSARL